MSHKTPHNPEPGSSHASEPDDLRDALDLWREDTAQAADRIDVAGDLADRVVASVEGQRPLALVPAGARWYAAAAVLLIFIGITGTLMARDADTTDGSRAVGFSDIEEAYIEALADAPELAPGLEGR